MKRCVAIFLLLGILLGAAALVACDGKAEDVTIGENDLIPNQNGGGASGGASEEGQGGIGSNNPVDLPYLPA